MAIIYTYPEVSPQLEDLLVLSDISDGKKTKSVEITNLKSIVNTTYVLVTAQNGDDVDIKLNDNAGATVSTVKLVKGSNIVLTDLGSNQINITSTGGGGGGGTPAAPINSIQYNNAGNFGGSANFVYDGTGKVTIGVGSTQTGRLDLESDGSSAGVLAVSGKNQYVTLIQGSLLDTAGYSITLPPAGPGGANKILESDASGILSWIATPGGGGGGMTSWTLSDGSITQTINDGDTVQVLGGTALTSVVAATDKVTLNHDNIGTPGTYAYPASITTNNQGHITNVTPGSAPGAGTVTSVGLTMPAAFTVTGSPLTGTGGTLGVTGAGTSSQYIKGDGTLGTYTAPANISSFTVQPNVGPTDTNPLLTIDDGTQYQIEASGSTFVGVERNTNSKLTVSLSATGTPGAGNFLRGDNTWSATPAAPVDSVSAGTSGVSTGSALTVSPTTGAVKVTSNAFGGLGNVGHVPTAAAAGIGSYLSHTGVWAVPTDTDTTYTMSAATDGSDVDLTLDASAGTDTTIQFTAGSNMTITQSGGNNITFASTGGGGSGFPTSVNAVSASGAVLADKLYLVTTSVGTPDIVITLPSASSNIIVGVKWVAQNAVTDTLVVKTVSSQTIDGVNRTTTGLPLASLYTYYEFISDGSNWWIK